MMVPEPFYSWQEHFAIELNGARAVFTTRRGGFSGGPFTSLNLGRLTDDAPDAVERNRAHVEQQAGRQLTFVRQVHGARVQAPSAPPANGTALQEADGQVTAEGGLAPVALTADCLPVALSCGQGVAMLHAGWRGLASGILGQGVSALRDLTGNQPITAAIGPGAGPCCYEVSEEVHRQFAGQAAVARRGNNLDLNAVARGRLAAAGVEEVHDISMCTICDPELFFSHRRDRGVTGRQAGLIWLT